MRGGRVASWRPEVWRCAAGLGTWRYLPQEIWSSGGMLGAWGRGGCRGLEVRCRCADAEVFASRDLELGSHAAGLGTWRYIGLEVRCRRADVEVYASRDLELGSHA